MTTKRFHLKALSAFSAAFMLICSHAASADEVGQVKTSSGSVTIQRGSQQLAAPVGTPVQASDTIVTGANSAVGITFIDNSRLSTGPNSVLAIDRYSFNQTTHEGAFQSSLKRGTLAVISGKIAKHTPDAMTVKTPSTILGARGTEFVVHVDDRDN